MTVEQILLLVVFLLLPPLNVFLRWLKRQHAAAERNERLQRERLREREQIPHPRSVRPPPKTKTDSIARPQRSQEPMAPVRPRRPLFRRVRALQDVRRGIVLLTILGPCRALEPPQ
jgi:hypothetical protein